jgi:hypothetical protein
MSRLPYVIAFASLVLAACGGDDGGTGDAPDADPSMPDAEPTPYGCVGRAHPTTAPAQITVSGISNEINTNGQEPLGAVAISVSTNGDVELGSTTSDATSGAYTISADTGGSPIDGYLHATHDSFKETYVYPPAPLSGDREVPVLMVSDSVYPFLPLIADAEQMDTNGFLGVLVVDCLGNPVAGATVTSAAAEYIRYVEGTSVGDATVTQTDDSGIAILFNVTPGAAVSVDASTADHDFEAHTVRVRADVVTTTVIGPGPITQAP